MKRLVKMTPLLLLLGCVIWNCEEGRKNPLADHESNIGKRSGELPKVVFLEQPYPNPIFLSQEGGCSIQFGLPQAMRVTLTVENVVGDVVRVLINQNLVAGVHSVIWDAKNNDDKPAQAGAYMVHLKTALVSQRKLIEIRE